MVRVVQYSDKRVQDVFTIEDTQMLIEVKWKNSVVTFSKLYTMV